jgi:hypothetical protein
VRGHAITDEQRHRAAAIIISHPTASIGKLTELIGLPHGTVGNLRLDCVRRGLVGALHDEKHLTAEMQRWIVVEYGAGYGMREVARRSGLSYYAVRRALSINNVELRAARRQRAPRERGADLPIGGDVLEVLCWCEESVVRVERERVRAGETSSCERPGCRERAVAS